MTPPLAPRAFTHLRRGELLPSAPPPELREDVERAGEVADELAAVGRELHFATHPLSGRVVVELRCLERGDVLRRLTCAEALAVAGRDLALD